MTGWAGLTYLLDGSLYAGLAVLAIGLGSSWWISPWQGGRTVRHRDVQAMSRSDRDVVIYWRPGCRFCARLKSSLGVLGTKAVWVNIWQDREAAEFVRSLNNGSETVPTVLQAGDPVTNPDPEILRERLSA